MGVITETSASVLPRSFATTISQRMHIPAIDPINPWQGQSHHRHHQKLQPHYLINRGISTTTSTDDEEWLPPPPGAGNVNGKFAVVTHGSAYEAAMQGRHGQQLALARLEGVGKDDLPFDPFVDEDYYEDDEDDDYEEDVQEAEIVENETKKDLKDGGEGGYEADDDTDEDVYEDEDDDDLDGESRYKPDGSVRRTKSVLATLRAGYPSGGLFAVVELGGIQSKVTTDDLLVVNRLQPVDTYRIGSVHTLTDVMLISSSHMTMVGMPYIAGAEVDVMVEEITQDAKVIIFKKRRRKHSQRKNGFRRDLTLLRVLDIRLPAAYREHKHVGRDSVDELDDVTPLVPSISSSSSLGGSNRSFTAISNKVNSVSNSGPSNKHATRGKKIDESSDGDDDDTAQLRVAQ
jgi:large subunit ribosomal protein L21